MLRLAATASSTACGKLEAYSASRNVVVWPSRRSQVPSTSRAICSALDHWVAYQFFHGSDGPEGWRKCHTAEVQNLVKFGAYQPMTNRTCPLAPGATVMWAACKLQS